MQINTVSLTGRLGDNPEVKFFESGSHLAQFSIAVKRTKEITDWFDCVCWDKTADIVANYCTKGKEVGVVGTLYHDIWEDPTTKTVRSKPMVRVERLTLLGSGSGGNGQASGEIKQPVIDDNF